MKKWRAALAFLVVGSSAQAIREPMQSTFVDINRKLPPQEQREWAEARQAVHFPEAKILKDMISKAPVDACALGTVYVEQRGVICSYPNLAALSDWRADAFVKNVLIPAQELSRQGYTVVTPVAGAKGDGYLASSAPAGIVNRKTIYWLITSELARRKSAQRVSMIMNERFE